MLDSTVGGPAAAAGPPVVLRPHLWLIAVTVAVLAQVLRAALLPTGHDVSAVVLVAAAGGLAAVAMRAVAGRRGLLLAGVGGLLLARLATQAFPPALWVALAGVAFGGLAVTALFEAGRGLSGTGFVVAVIGGLTGDTALRLAFGTWDPALRTGAVPWLVCALLIAAGAAALVRVLRAPPVEPPAIGWRDALGATALGPFLALQILVLASPAFVASSGSLPPPAAGAVVLIAQALSLALLSSGLAVAAVPGGVCVLGGTVLGVAAAAITGRYGLYGHVATAAVIAGQVLSAWLLAVACRVPLRRGGYRGREPREAERTSVGGAGSRTSQIASVARGVDTGGRAWRVDLCAAFGAVLIVAVLLPYQMHYQAPLPLPNKVLPGAAGIVLGLLAAIAAARGGPLPARSARRALGVGVAALLPVAVPAGYAATAPQGRPSPAFSGTFRLVSYDIRQGMDADGRLDPESVARVIEAQHADVVALQEVGRGWPMSGTADVGAWLARRLGMRLVWGPAADRQFGNAVLTRLPVLASGYGRLPVGGGPQARGYVWARVGVGGRTADVWSVDVQHGTDRTQTRLAEIGELLGAWSGAPRTAIAGNLYAHAGGPELGRLTGEGDLREAGGGTAAVSVFGSDDLGFENTAAAGLAMATTVRIVG
jgi:endonuclease/exonuclease/phosphatase family metal-dependent hydrolase